MNIKPFQGIRPAKGLESKIAALPYDVYSTEEARREIQKEPLSFLKIDRAETQFEDGVNPYQEKVYQKASTLIWEMIENKQLIQDNMDCYYIYELVMDNRAQTGIVACASIDDYENNKIKKHENTISKKEVDRINHVSICNMQTGPIFLAYRTKQSISDIISNQKKENPICDFTATDGIIHRVWMVNNQSIVQSLQNELEQLEHLYIADGHHRCASAVKVGLQRRVENPNYTGKEEFNFFLSVLFPDNELMIMDYNRVIKDLHGYTTEGFLHQLESIMEIEKGQKPDAVLKPKKKGELTMYLEDSWYYLRIKDKYKVEDPVLGLDVSILQDQVLAPMLNIQDPKTDDRIDFVGGVRGLEELVKRVNIDCKVAFAMYPTHISELFHVADSNLLMPPKSTWFEPKLRSGLFLHSIKQ